MTPGLFEHGFFVVVVLALPFWAFWQHRGLVADLAAGKTDARARAYRRTIALEWALAALVIVRWGTSGQLPGVLGAGDTGTVRWWIGIALAAAGSILLVWQTTGILRSAERMAQVRPQLEPLQSIIPADAREGRLFAGLAVTAGVCEEVMYRGFLIAYFAAFSPLWVAVALASAIFGLGHAYQGAAGILKTGLVGIAMAVLLLLTGALWAPILVHAVIDLTSGHLGRKVLALPPTSASPRL